MFALWNRGDEPRHEGSAVSEHDEYNELLSVVGDIVSAGHMDQEHLARLRAHLGCRPDPAGVVREVASREGEAPNRLPPLPPINILEASAFHGDHLVISAEAARRREEVLLAYITRTARSHAAQGAVEREPSAIPAAAHAVILARDNFGWSSDVDTKIEDLRRVLAGEPSGDALDARLEALMIAAGDVVERWDTPLWKDAPATAGFINRLRAAITAARQEPK